MIRSDGFRVGSRTMLDGHLHFRRYRHRQGLPMHNKFILIDPRGREVIFGSMNLSNNSLHANHEILVVSASTFSMMPFKSGGSR